ncbi:MAG: restriction endonuclease [Planctomycetota bacterium]|nr:MAG: restriction endonuclease [Planctomycetota bacterium]
MDSNPTPNCPGDQCLSNWLKWAHQTTNNNLTEPPPNGSKPFQAKLFEGTLYDDAAPKIRNAHEFRSAVETLAYAVFRLARNRLTRAERPRLENLVDNAIFKMLRHLQHGNPVLDQADIAEFEQLQNQVSEDRRLADRRKAAAQGIKHRLEQLEKLTPEEFEDFIGEVFEALDFQVERVGGSGDQGADLKLTRGPARAVVQCKFYKKSLIGSPELQKFLGTIHQSESQKGYFVTTSCFSLSAEKFAANQPIELIDGPRLAELVRELVALDRSARDEAESTLF